MACKQANDKNKRLDSYYPFNICFMSHASSLKGASINQSAYGIPTCSANAELATRTTAAINKIWVTYCGLRVYL